MNGNITQLIPDLVDIGVNVINPVPPDCIDAADIIRQFGDRRAMGGTLGYSRQWDWGTPDQSGLKCSAVSEKLGPEVLLLAPAYDIN